MAPRRRVLVLKSPETGGGELRLVVKLEVKPEVGFPIELILPRTFLA